jgi:outer membrane murein-binding lipoprotein Lpp
MKLVHLTVVGSLVLAGCATSPKDIQASYVSPVPYQAMNCQQLGEEAQRVSAPAMAATGQQQSQANKDAVAMGVALFVLWPAIFFVGGDKGNAAQIAQLKGEMNAIEQVNAAKNCGIQFQRS